MSEFQAEKALIRRFHAALDRGAPEAVAGVLANHVAPGWHWRGVHPFHEQCGPEAVAAVFWRPLKQALTSLRRRPDIFFAGRNEIDAFASVWVAEMGHFMGLFDRPFLGIPPTRRIAMLRYAEFHRVVDGRVVETALFTDLPQLMLQAGENPFPPQTGAHLVQPGPATHDGLLYEPQDPAAGEATLAVINAMISDRFAGGDYAGHLARTWHDDMIWWGPIGIGATFTIPRYIEQHAAPFRESLSEGYRFNGHVCRLAEGSFGGFFGWPNLTLTNAGGYLGMTGTAQAADMRVVDLYRVADGKLAENWVFIDLLHWLSMQGLDALTRMRSRLGVSLSSSVIGSSALETPRA